MFEQAYAEKFWSKLTKDRFDNDCWLFQYRREPQYFHVQYAPYLEFGGKVVQAHRIAYILVNGPVPAGLVVRHRCGVGGCCNPSHMIVGTQQQNCWDRWARHFAGIDTGALATYEDLPEYVHQ